MSANTFGRDLKTFSETFCAYFATVAESLAELNQCYERFVTTLTALDAQVKARLQTIDTEDRGDDDPRIARFKNAARDMAAFSQKYADAQRALAEDLTRRLEYIDTLAQAPYEGEGE